MDQQEIQKAKETKDQLAKVSASFCTVKWKHATLNLGAGTVKSCCHLPFRSLENLDQFHDTKRDQKERREMLKGDRPGSCSYCWWMEDQGQLSDRIVWSSKSWMAPFTETVAQSKSETAQNPSWVELNFSNLCNLKCSYCSPLFSTKWTKEIKDYGAYPTLPKYNDLNSLKSYGYVDSFDNSKIMERFWPWFEKAYSGMRLLKITGGEPFLSEHTFKILEWVVKHPNKDLSLSINSNLTIPEKQWTRFLDLILQIKNNQCVSRFYLHPSIDSFGSQAEYIRHGLDFSLFQKNVESYLQKGVGDLVFICTLNNLSFGGLKNFWEYLLELKKTYGHQAWISLTTEVLMSPDWQSLNILPKHFDKYLLEAIEFVRANVGSSSGEFSSFELWGLERALEMFRAERLNMSRARENFYLFFAEHDRRRGTSLPKTFPELAEFWEICRQTHHSTPGGN